MEQVKPEDSRLQTNTEILMDCQEELKMLIKQAMYDVGVMATFERRKNKIIDEAVEQLDDEELKETAVRVLREFADKEYRIMVSLLRLGTLPLVLAFAGGDLTKAVNKNVAQREINIKVADLDIKTIVKAHSHLANSQPKVSYSQSLYGKAELNARFKEQQEMVDNLRKITNLVICDTHSDCSDRCFQWQGRVYSLDGTSGITSDGRKYVPLEVATNAIFKGHRNGLLGYNCRHKLVPYEKGLKPIYVPRAEQRKEKQISEKQRLLEREIRKNKAIALQFKEENAPIMRKKEIREKYKTYKERVSTLTKEYKQFCQENNRVEYRSRLKV